MPRNLPSWIARALLTGGLITGVAGPIIGTSDARMLPAPTPTIAFNTSWTGGMVVGSGSAPWSPPSH
jgi:hypothetical protein